jgi:transcriptional regulator GlxA family with amidase domain
MWSLSAKGIYMSQEKKLSVKSSVAAEPNEQICSPRYNTKVHLALALINEQYTQSRLKLRDIAKQLNISVWHLSRLFKKEIGYGVIRYLRAVRMGKAQELLQDTTLSIKEIAAAVGYNHVSDFDRHFKASSGMRPGEFREALITNGYNKRDQNHEF